MVLEMPNPPMKIRPDLRHLSLSLKLLLVISLAHGLLRATRPRRPVADPALAAAPPASTRREATPLRPARTKPLLPNVVLIAGFVLCIPWALSLLYLAAALVGAVI